MILGCDVDSTVWPFHDWFCEALPGMTYEGWRSWDYCYETFDQKAVLKAFAKALEPKRVPERTLYPGVQEAIARLKRWGISIHFITHNYRPDEIRPYLVPWLKENFGEDVGVTVVPSSVSKLEILENLGALGMVDDHPTLIADVADAGMFAATKIHPWNREMVEAHLEVYGFESWEVLPYLLSVWTSERKEAVAS